MKVTRVVIVVLAVAVALLGLHAFSRTPKRADADSVVKTRSFRGARFDVVELPLNAWSLRVDWSADGGVRLRDVAGSVRTNAGIFEPGFVPTGVLISDGVIRQPLNEREGAGNFFLMPNGVFALTTNGDALIRETHAFETKGIQFATQSGPLLLRGGIVHPQLKEESPNRALRSGIGVKDARHVVLVISRDDVNLWTFAALFRDELKCSDALYLDGVISALWADGAGRDADLEKGPFAGVLRATPK